MIAKDTPDQPGVYYFVGPVIDGDETQQWKQWIHVEREFQGPGVNDTVSIFGSDVVFRLEAFEGKWYGPIEPPVK